MDWTQALAIIGTTVGSLFVFYKLTRDEIAVLREGHREDTQRWAALFEKFHILDKDLEKFRISSK